ncbi:unnamed protein product (plasmid) [Mycetohabitans rhizoxinica HKI 454]|uniref:Uncharacterized protein n=1 Tax=Mycetohabitans rhizoxinica (strain DSM 19002 / CIP 109453 / HKI 454) TaxID=882378 RepID=E5AU33_MYCRK|nr:unnamed protein product [Mycetohabitans rhizoxinica HKI 454]
MPDAHASDRQPRLTGPARRFMGLAHSVSRIDTLIHSQMKDGWQDIGLECLRDTKEQSGA